MRGKFSERPKNPTDRWKDRHHRVVKFELNKDGSQSDLSVYITRPTFEKLRSSKKSKNTFRLVRDTVRSLKPIYEDEEKNAILPTELEWKGTTNDDETFFVALNKSDSDSNLELYSIISGPYNVDKEMNSASNAILIDI